MKLIPSIDFLETRNLLSSATLLTSAHFVAVPSGIGTAAAIGNVDTTLLANVSRGSTLTETVTETITVSESNTGVISSNVSLAGSLQVTYSTSATPANSGVVKAVKVFAHEDVNFLFRLTKGSSVSETVVETITVSDSNTGVISTNVVANETLSSDGMVYANLKVKNFLTD